jgi:hypothetical protein
MFALVNRRAFAKGVMAILRRRFFKLGAVSAHVRRLRNTAGERQKTETTAIASQASGQSTQAHLTYTSTAG